MRKLLATFGFLLASTSTPVLAQLDVFKNQEDFGFFSVGFSGTPTMWDDLQITQGGLLSEISFIARPPPASDRQPQASSTSES